MKSTRRDFLKFAAMAAAAGLVPLPSSLVWAEKKGKKKAGFPDLVGVREGTPARMFEAGIKVLGGMGRFVKKGQTVLVKPNIGWNKTPSEGANTNPDLVGKIVELAYAAGAKKVYVFDHAVNVERECHRRSGIKKAVEGAKGVMRSAAKKRSYREVKLKGAEVLGDVLVHELYLDSDVVINVPILKNHGGGVMTAAMKNLMGVVWDRRYWHREGLHEAIGEFTRVRKPDLNVVDAYLVMVKHGPRGLSTKDLVLKKMQILSPDIVLADAAAARVLGIPADDIPYLSIAEKLGLGSLDLDKADIKRISLKS